jgi:ketosteroid isomerase-like protein
MKRTGSLASFVIFAASLAFGQFACSKPADTNRVASPAASNANSEKPRVDTAAIEKELTRIENDWPRVLKEKDAAAVRRVEAEDAVVIYPDGTVGSQAQDIKDIETGALSADSWEVTDLKVTVLNDDAAFASGRSIIKGGKARTPDGKTTNIDGQIRWIDTFARRNGQWKLVGSISTPIQKPEASPATPKASPAATMALASPPKPKS